MEDFKKDFNTVKDFFTIGNLEFDTKNMKRDIRITKMPDIPEKKND